MSHIIEAYAKDVGVKIGKPFIYEDYFPLTIDNYITIHTTSKPAKTYSYWQEVINIIKPYLDKEGIDIIQIGGKDDRKVEGIYDLCGQSTINQTAYILKNSKLHIGVDSFPAHIASYYNKKIVCVYANNYVECVKPYWTKPEDLVAFTSYKDGKPLFSLEDPERYIDKIKPEDIAKAVLDFLGLKYTIDFKTVYIGKSYLEKHFEIAPKAIANIDDKNAPLVIRMDYHFDENTMLNQLASHNHCYIITDKPFNVKSIQQFKDRIKQIQYTFRRNYDIEFVKDIYTTGIPFGLNCELPEEGNQDIKLDFMDFAIVTFEKVFDPKDASEFNDVNFDNLYYKSCKILNVGGKNYYGRQSWSLGQEVKQYGEFKKLKDSVEFWKEIDYCMVVEKIKI